MISLQNLVDSGRILVDFGEQEVRADGLSFTDQPFPECPPGSYRTGNSCCKTNTVFSRASAPCKSIYSRDASFYRGRLLGRLLSVYV